MQLSTRDTVHITESYIKKRKITKDRDDFAFLRLLAHVCTVKSKRL